MKKLLVVLALIMAYGVSISNAAPTISIEESTVTVVADNDDFSPVIEEEKKKKKKKTEGTACTGQATAKKASGEKPSTGCSDAQKKSCAASGKTCGEAKATTAKKACCGSKK